MAEPSSIACPACRGRDSAPSYSGIDRMHGGEEVHTYRRCTACGVDFLHPMPHAAQIAAFYPDEYAPFQVQPHKPARALERAVLRARDGYRHLEVPHWARLLAPFARCAYQRTPSFVEGGRLLDVGCGGGKFLAAMRSLGWDVAGLDRDPRAVAACRARGIDAVTGELPTAELPAGGFDRVTARHVIEHVSDPRAFAAALVRVLRPGGRLHVRTPNGDALGRLHHGAAWYANDIPRHVVVFGRRGLTRLLEAAGFRAVSVRTRSTPKVLVNSRNALREGTGRPRNRRLARLAARPHVWFSAAIGRGYELVGEFRRVD